MISPFLSLEISRQWLSEDTLTLSHWKEHLLFALKQEREKGGERIGRERHESARAL